MTCDPTKYRSSTLFWDNESFKKSLDKGNINYSVSIEERIEKILYWDNQSYIANNPDNFSYSYQEIFPLKNYDFLFRYRILRCLYDAGSRTYSLVWGSWSTWGTFQGPTVVKQVNTIWMNGSQQGDNCGGSSYASFSWRMTYINTSGQTQTTNITSIFLQTRDGEYEYTLTPQDGIRNYELTINDGGSTIINSLVDPSTLNLITNNLPPDKKIIVDGHEFPLIDENSIELLCTDPIKQCPDGTIECDCGDMILCLVPTNKGYKVVECFVK